MPQALSLVWLQEFGITKSQAFAQRLTFIFPVYAVLCYTAVKHGRCLACRRRKLIPFTYDAFVASLELHGNKRFPTRKFWGVLVLPPCTLPSVSAGFAGSVMFWGWVLSEFQSLLYGELVVGKRNRGRPKLRFKEVCKRDLKRWNIRTDKLELQMTAPKGDLLYTKDWKKREKEYFEKQKKMKKWEPKWI